ncbi:UNVERIFIED_CONTAM: protein WVD2-like 2 [Sesamum latifolium]|uniref:Protein WVD2-like 2 n=1 Tax=Sesamum latifolium TaxID=2727402 RepID=A0AAW2UZ87_9LAMI
MGRDVTGLRVDKKPSMVNVISNGTNDATVHVSPKASPEKVETGDYEPADHTVKGRIPDKYKEKQDVTGVKNIKRELEEKINETEARKSIGKTLSWSTKLSSGPVVDGTTTANSLEQSAPTTEDEKQTLYTKGVETNDSGVEFSPRSNDLHSPKNTEKLQPNSPSMSTKQQLLHYKNVFDEEDNCSMASSDATSQRTNRFRVTVPVAPKFTCLNRLEKRKEEVEAAAIKELRKSMVYKANPVPDFYREGPPPKPELKKIPVTRAKSPKLTRRNSCGDAVKNSAKDKVLCERAARHDVSFYRSSTQEHQNHSQRTSPFHPILVPHEDSWKKTSCSRSPCFFIFTIIIFLILFFIVFVIHHCRAFFLASSQDSSNSYPFSLLATTAHRCHGLDLLVKAIHQVTAGSVIGVPYIQRRVKIRRRRRRRALQFDSCIFAELFEQKKGQQNEKKLNSIKKKQKGKNSVAKGRQRRVMGLPSKLQDSVLQPWGRSAAADELGL